MTEQAGDFEQFMRARERAAVAYVNGDPEPVDELATNTEPASFFGPDGGTLAGPAAVRAAYRSGTQMFTLAVRVASRCSTRGRAATLPTGVASSTPPCASRRTVRRSRCRCESPRSSDVRVRHGDSSTATPTRSDPE